MEIVSSDLSVVDSCRVVDNATNGCIANVVLFWPMMTLFCLLRAYDEFPSPSRTILLKWDVVRRLFAYRVVFGLLHFDSLFHVECVRDSRNVSIYHRHTGDVTP